VAWSLYLRLSLMMFRWRSIFLVPCVITLISAVAFIALFRDPVIP